MEEPAPPACQTAAPEGYLDGLHGARPDAAGDIFPMCSPASLMAALTPSVADYLKHPARSLALFSDGVRGLNSLAGFSGFSTGKPRAPQLEVAARVIGLISRRFGPCDAPTGEAALKSLLKGFSGYDCSEEPTSLASFSLSRLSLPKDSELIDCPNI